MSKSKATARSDNDWLHEAMDRAYILERMLTEHLGAHEGIRIAKARKECVAARLALVALYSKLGSAWRVEA